MHIRIEGSGPLKDSLSPEGYRLVAKEGPEPLSETLKGMHIPLEAVLAATIDGKIVDLGYCPCDGDTVRLIPLLGGG